ncbi:hypothetical protein PHLCEN_2v2177 [Hermanssonia centrifuga]|uniref:Uncharacterized protein n=1 Tax=Hermanssonia centrifuga TaxID=98765 RepID=A0A2R6RPW2_9APHY|nr:hypothetical protein PHLCEN_2v2177 [Hermanssonia centrifuga]
MGEVPRVLQLIAATVMLMGNLNRFVCEHFPECVPSLCSVLSRPITSTLTQLCISTVRTTYLTIGIEGIMSTMEPNLPFLTAIDLCAYFITAHPTAYAEFFQRLLASRCHKLVTLVLRARLEDVEYLLQTSDNFLSLETLVVHFSALAIRKLALADGIHTLQILEGSGYEESEFEEVSIPQGIFPRLQTLSCPANRLLAFTSNRMERPYLTTVRLDDAFFLSKGRLPRSHQWPLWESLHPNLLTLQHSTKNLVDLSFCVPELDVHALLAAGLEFPRVQRLTVCTWKDPLNVQCLSEDEPIRQFLSGLPSLRMFRLSDGPMYEDQRPAKLFSYESHIAFQKTVVEKWGMSSSTLNHIALTTAYEWHRQLGSWYREGHERHLHQIYHEF